MTKQNKSKDFIKGQDHALKFFKKAINNISDEILGFKFVIVDKKPAKGYSGGFSKGFSVAKQNALEVVKTYEKYRKLIK